MDSTHPFPEGFDLMRYNRLRNAWVKKYGTFRNFDRWYGLNREIERLKQEKS